MGEQPAVQTAGKSATNMATGSATASSNAQVIPPQVEIRQKTQPISPKRIKGYKVETKKGIIPENHRELIPFFID